MRRNDWCCFVINLARSPARMRRIADQLGDAGIAFRRFEAIDGRNVDPDDETLFRRDLYERRHGKTPTQGEIGCFLSHIGVMREFLATDSEFCLILEDDAIVKPRLARTFEGLARVADQWDVAMMYGNYSGAPQTQAQLDGTHRLVGFMARQTGAVAYAVNRRAAQIYLRELLPMSLPIDIDFDRAWDFGIKFRGILPFPVTTGAHPSDIGATGRKFSWHRRLPTYAARGANELRRLYHYAFRDPIWLNALRFRLLDPKPARFAMPSLAARHEEAIRLGYTAPDLRAGLAANAAMPQP